MKDTIETIIVEDDPMVGKINSRYLLSQEGFSLRAVFRNSEKALEHLSQNPHDIDLIILDIFMPDLDGISLLREIRRQALPVEVIIVSAASDPTTINRAIRNGAFDYITKPFQPERLFESLKTFRNMKEQSDKRLAKFEQKDIDMLFSLRNRKQGGSLPKGLGKETLEKIKTTLGENEKGLSANEVAAILHISRVTVRRYLEHLVFTGEATLERRFQDVGRPLNIYRIIK